MTLHLAMEEQELGDEDGGAGDDEQDPGEDREDGVPGLRLPHVVKHDPEVCQVIAVTNSHRVISLLQGQRAARPRPGQRVLVPPDAGPRVRAVQGAHTLKLQYTESSKFLYIQYYNTPG